MDKTDIQILSILLNNCRTPNRKIAEIVGIASNSVSKRIEKMLENEIIKKFSLSIEPLTFGLNIVYFVTSSYDWKEIMKKLQLVGEPYFVVTCVGGITICSILTQEKISNVTKIAQSLLDEVRILNIFEAPSFDINRVLTKTDLEILKILLDEPRAQIEHLAKTTGLSTKTVSRSLEKLQTNDIIHFTLEYNPMKLEDFISFAVLVMSNKDVKQTESNLRKKVGQFYLQNPWLSKNQMVLFLYSDDVYKMDEITTTVRHTAGVETTDLFIPKMSTFPQEWVRKGIDQALLSPTLHIG